MLPTLKNELASKIKIENFTGLNRTDAASDGALTDSLNLSSRHYPALSTRKGRRNAVTTQKGSALYAWDELVWVDGTTLYTMDRSGDTPTTVALATVTEGEKQFAVINSKLVIWPDKLVVDLQTKDIKRMDATISAPGSSVTASGVNLTFSETDPVIATQTENFTYNSDEPLTTLKYTALEWDIDSRLWTKEGEEEKNVSDIASGDLLIPSSNNLIRTKTTNESYTAENTEGNYLKVKSVSKSGTTECKWEKWESELNYSYDEYYIPYYEEGPFESNDSYSDYAESVTLYSSYSFNSSNGTYSNAGSATTYNKGTPGSGYIALGDSVNSVSYSEYGVISVSTSTAVYAPKGPYYEEYTYYSKGSKKIGDVYADKGTYPNNGRNSADGYWYVFVSETGFDGTVSVTYDVYGVGTPKLTTQFKVGDRVSITGLPCGDVSRVKIVEISDYEVSFEEGSFAGTTGESVEETVTIKRDIPNLDYICTSNNRLWGVCNDDKSTLWDAETETFKEVTARTIWASALGLPERFYDYDGLSTDSYAVAVGSPSDFTGIIDYSGSVLCWKEDVLHRIAGDYPANYVMYTDYYNGLQAGSEKSMIIINEVLYYKGRDGVYAFSGGQPQLISYRLGEEHYEAARAGERAGRYYISMRNSMNISELLSFDTIRDCWYAEDDMDVIDFAELRGTLYALTSTGPIYAIGEGENTETEWSATLAEWTEGTYEYKQYRRIHIDADISDGAELKVYVKTDDNEEKQIWETRKFGRQRFDIPIHIARAKRVIVRLAGKGDVVIRRITRDVALRG